MSSQHLYSSAKHSVKITSSERRRARTRTLIQVGALAERAGLLESFGIVLGEDLQKSPTMKNPTAALFKGLLVLNEMAQREEEVNMQLWELQGLEALTTEKQKFM